MWRGLPPPSAAPWFLRFIWWETRAALLWGMCLGAHQCSGLPDVRPLGLCASGSLSPSWDECPWLWIVHVLLAQKFDSSFSKELSVTGGSWKKSAAAWDFTHPAPDYPKDGLELHPVSSPRWLAGMSQGLAIKASSDYGTGIRLPSPDGHFCTSPKKLIF